MGDIFYGKSRQELKREIDVLVAKESRSLPANSKIFAAVATLQKFDQLPEVLGSSVALTTWAQKEGANVELNRGLASSNNVLASVYAKDLLHGPLYPGTQTALGAGIYMAEPTLECDEAAFGSLKSHVARDYAEREKPGTIVRAYLKPNSQIMDIDELRDLQRENRSRARDTGLIDIGAFAAALGFDAYYCDGVYDHTHERVWVVLNRAALVFQSIGLKVAL